ncbi:unnamed protein product [Penicillium egyptiacum]|uniref:Uncharacterized protein n=1 Tax=Penicillium egyptiacum TaxID=1303716 RepID=A0A9W4K482_9EURO|nr:unnamed protein product [Penicillium egyptiacum]
MSVISAEVAVFFQNKGLLGPAKNNKRTISVTALSSPATSRSSSSSSNSIDRTSFSATFVNVSRDEIELPQDLTSGETYEFIGFDKETAGKLWDQYLSRPIGDPLDPFDFDFMDYARSQVKNSTVPDVLSVTDDWTPTMAALGINYCLQQSILHPDFDDVRATASCKFWLLDSMEMAFKTLEGLNGQLRQELERRQRLTILGVREKSPFKSLKSAAKETTIPNECPATDIVAEQEAPARLIGYTMIWRACLLSEAVECCESRPGELQITPVCSRPGDFSGRTAVAYFSPERETADRYAAYKKHRFSIAELAILQVAVPDSLMQSLSVNYLWADGVSDLWKKVVWNCRRGDRLPKDLRYMRNKDLWIGHIARSKNVKFETMESCTQIQSSDAPVVQINGERRNATQWVFHSDHAEELFAQCCKGKTWIHSIGKLVEVFKDMAFAKSLKSDPLGIIDTRLTMTDSPTDGFFSPLFEPFTGFTPFTGFDGADKRQPGSQTEAEASPKQAHRILELRESFRGFDSSRNCPRLELDVAVDKYHTLDGLAEPLNPQNTPASNSERGSTEEYTESFRRYQMENLRRSPTPQTEEFNFDCFQDSPEASFVCQDDESESEKPSKLRRLSVGRRQWIKPPITALANHQPGINANFKEPGNPGSLLRSVRFSPPAASLSPPSRAARRPLPSIERGQDYVALHRQKKQYRKWKVAGRANSRKCSPCNSPTKRTQSLAARIPKNHDMRNSSLFSLPDRETRQMAFPTRVAPGADAREVRTSEVVDTPVASDSNIAGKTERNLPAFLAVSFSLYRIRPAPSSSSKKAPKYAFRFRMTRTDLPQQPSPHFPTKFENLACHPIIDDLLFHICFIIPAIVVLLPLNVVFIATYPLTNTRVGAVMLYLVRALLYLLINIIIFVLFKCGVTCGCQWNPDTGNSG